MHTIPLQVAFPLCFLMYKNYATMAWSYGICVITACIMPMTSMISEEAQNNNYVLKIIRFLEEGELWYSVLWENQTPPNQLQQQLVEAHSGKCAGTRNSHNYAGPQQQAEVASQTNGLTKTFLDLMEMSVPSQGNRRQYPANCRSTFCVQDLHVLTK